jgi:hypothetical protein
MIHVCVFINIVMFCYINMIVFTHIRHDLNMFKMRFEPSHKKKKGIFKNSIFSWTF